MTPEEKAVIGAAERWARAASPADAEDRSDALQDAVSDLLRARDRHCIAEHDPLAPCEWCLMPTTSEWVSATLVQCLAGDHIRIGTDETDVLRSSSGIWHADNSDAWQPKKWNHLELRMELAANPKQPGVERSGFCEYPPNLPCEILCTSERKAVLLLQTQFPGSAVTSSDVD